MWIGLVGYYCKVMMPVSPLAVTDWHNGYTSLNVTLSGKRDLGNAALKSFSLR